MFESVQVQNGAFLKNLEMQPANSDRYQKLEKEVYGILQQDSKQHSSIAGTPAVQQQSLFPHRYSPGQVPGTLPPNIMQQLQQKKQLSPQIQQILQ